MLTTIGNTPITKLRHIVPSDAGDVWIKIESMNPTGSYKDRAALAMIEEAERAGAFSGSRRLLECTGGSTGTSLAFICAIKQIPLTIISSDAYAQSKLDSMEAFGAELLIEPSLNNQITPDLWPRMRQRASNLVAAGTHYWIDQFNNPHATKGYSAMGHEIIEQVPQPIDAFCGCVGTAGMIVGAGQVIREHFPRAQIVAIEPDSSPVLSGGTPGAHQIDGIAAGFIPPMFDPRIVTAVRTLPEQTGRDMARRLAREEGIFAGTSTGMNILAAIELARELGPGSTVATVACDSGFKYLHGDLFHPGATP